MNRLVEQCELGVLLQRLYSAQSWAPQTRPQQLWRVRMHLFCSIRMYEVTRDSTLPLVFHMS